jgi:excisionase family DNA binding protein
MEDLGHNTQTTTGANDAGKQSLSRGNFASAGTSMNATIEPLIDATQAARMLKLHPVTVREMASRGAIPGLKIGKVWRFRASSLDEWVTRQIESSCYPLSHQREER